eukprot:UN28068
MLVLLTLLGYMEMTYLIKVAAPIIIIYYERVGGAFILKNRL